jgi:hypothetical protein
MAAAAGRRPREVRRGEARQGPRSLLARLSVATPRRHPRRPHHCGSLPPPCFILLAAPPLAAGQPPSLVQGSKREADDDGGVEAETDNGRGVES